MNALFAILEEVASNPNITKGLVAIGAGIAVLTGFASSLGEGWVVCKAIEGISRNPENEGKLRSLMILGVALVETCGIYGLLVAILNIFILGA